MSLADWDIVSSDIESTSDQFGGRWGNLLSKYLNGEDIGISYPTKRPRIRTLTRFGPGAFKIDDIEGSHTLGIEVDNISSGPGKILKVKAFTIGDSQYAVTEEEPQVLINKQLGNDTGPATIGSTILGHKLDANLKDIEKIAKLGIRDLTGDNVVLATISGSGSNSQFDVLKDYAGIGGATDIVYSIGNNSKIHKFQIWSKGDGTNKKFFEIIHGTDRIHMFAPLDMNSQELLNFAQITDKSKLHSEIAYKDETNWLATNMIQNSAVNDSKISDVAFSKVTGQIAMTQITDNSITNAKLQQIADAAKIQDGLITNAKINDVAYGKLTGVPASFTPSAHKNTHLDTTGSDKFVKGDRLFAAAIYLENRTDVSADKARFWLESGGDDIRYWSDDSTSVKHSVATDLNTLSLSNKTLINPTISTIINTGTITLPTATTTLVGRDTTDTLASKTLNAAKISNYLNFTKQVSAPSDPANAEEGILYLKEIDTDNNGIFVKHQQGGIMVEEQISPLPLVETYLNDLEDVSWITPLPNQRPIWDGTNLVNSPPPPSENPEIKSGEWIPLTSSTSRTQLFTDGFSEVGAITYAEDSKGRYATFTTVAADPGPLVNPAGIYQTVARYRREYNSKLYCYFRGAAGTSNTRYLIGFSESATPPSSDTPLNSGTQGVFVMLRSADNGSPPGTFKVVHNDLSDATNTTDTGVLYVDSNTYHKVEIHLSSTDVKIYINDQLTNTLTTEIPATTIPLYPYVMVHKAGGGEKPINIYKVGVISK